MQRKKLWKLHKTKSIALQDATAGCGITVMGSVKKNNGMNEAKQVVDKEKNAYKRMIAAEQETK